MPANATKNGAKPVAKDTVSHIHLVSRMLKEEVYYPEHAPRKATAEYRAMHKQLVVEQDHPCLVCGVRNSTINDPQKNLVHAKQIETHHHIVEWSLANAIDLAKFNDRIVSHLRHRNPHKYGNDFTQQQMEDWVDHDPDNIWVLCDVHHRHSLVGIHSITGPIFGPQDLIRDDYDYTPAANAPAQTQ